MRDPFDLLLIGGRVVDPAAGVDGLRDVAIANGRIAAVLPPGRDPAAREAIDCRGRLVLPGLIDTHAHVYQHVTGRFGLNADLCGVRSGVTTLVDQGGPSCVTLPGFRAFVVEPAATRVLAFISSYLVGGLEGHYYTHLYSPDGVDVAATVAAVRANRDLVKGVKAHAEIGGFARWGAEVLRRSAAIGREAGLPLYIHFGQLWPTPHDGGRGVDPDAILAAVLEVLKPGDILAHPFSRHPGGFVGAGGTLHPMVKEALARGARIDVGPGSHWSFRMARTVLDAGVVPDTLGADMHGYNTRVPAPPGTPESHPDEHVYAGQTPFSLVSAMTSMVALGLSLEQVVPMVTSRAAEMVGMAGEIGTLAAGAAADVTVLDDAHGRWTLRDGEGTQVTADRMLTPVFCLRGGQRFTADAPILPVPAAA
jgi:dihydroorotase